MIFVEAAAERIIAGFTYVQLWSIWAEQGCILHFLFIFVAILLNQKRQYVSLLAFLHPPQSQLWPLRHVPPQPRPISGGVGVDAVR